MPIPKPREGETQRDFVSRCIPAVKKDDPDRPDKQVQAICFDAFRRNELTLPARCELRGEPVELEVPAPETEVGAGRRISMHAFTGAPVAFMGTPVVFDLAGAEVTQEVPVLHQHDPTRIVGLSQKVEVLEDGVHLRGRTFDTPASREVVSLADQRFPWQASMGANPLEAEWADEAAELNGRQVEAGFIHVKRWEMKESSFVPLGKDGATSSTVLALSDERIQVKPGAVLGVTKGGANMPDEMTADEAVKQERERVAAIQTEFADDPAFALQQVAAGASLLEAQAAYAKVLKQQMAELRAQPNPPPVMSRPAPGKEPPAQATATERWNAALQQRLQAGQTRWGATRQLAIEDPELHQAYLEEHNASRPKRQMRRRK